MSPKHLAEAQRDQVRTATSNVFALQTAKADDSADQQADRAWWAAWGSNPEPTD